MECWKPPSIFRLHIHVQSCKWGNICFLFTSLYVCSYMYKHSQICHVSKHKLSACAMFLSSFTVENHKLRQFSKSELH